MLWKTALDVPIDRQLRKKKPDCHQCIEHMTMRKKNISSQDGNVKNKRRFKGVIK